jgi:hypothetical protein
VAGLYHANSHDCSRAGLKTTLVERAAGNARSMLNMGQELLVRAVQRELKHLDEKLFLEVFGGDERPPKRKRRSA